MKNLKKYLKKIKNTRIHRTALNKLTLKSKLQGMLLLTSLGSLLVIGTTSWLQARTTLEDKIADQLIGVRTAKGDQFELFFENLYNQVGTLAEDGTVVEAMVDFNRGFRQLERKFPESEIDPVLEAYYTKEFFPLLSKNLLNKDELEYITYRPSGQAGRYLQYKYLAKNPNPIGKKDSLLDAGDGSFYNQVHKKHQTYFRKLIQKFGYYDLFLINHRTGDMVYSVYKETDYATNLLNGPYSRSGLADAVREVKNNPQAGSIQVVDFKPYRPSYEAPAAFVAVPIFSGFNFIGILAVQVPIDKINRVMSQDNDWEAAGLGKTGEAYLVGSDLSMRSMSRFLEEQPKRYKVLARRNGTPKKTIELIEKLNTTIGLQKVDNQASQFALGGGRGGRGGRLNYF
ncbi:MAG: cache domain-containing protein [Cyanobacteria bacterium J06635_10]